MVVVQVVVPELGVLGVQVIVPMLLRVPWLGPVAMLKLKLFPSASDRERVIDFAVSSAVMTL
ncbi:MAG: hypothetical protein C4345_11475 [Chloroflexota bacterium]